MKPSVAPTIFMMAISSRRSKVVSLMVLEIMNTEITSSTAMRAMLMRLATFRTVKNPLEMASSARTFTMPGVASRSDTTCCICAASVRWITYRWRKMEGSKLLYRSSSSYCST